MVSAIILTIDNEEQRNELADFYFEHNDKFCSIAFSKLHNKQDAEDAVLEAFSEIAKKPERFFDIPPNKRLVYVEVMVRNIAVKMFNAKDKVYIEELNEKTEDVTVSFEKNVLDKIAYNELVSFIKQLPTKQKDVLFLYCGCHLKFFEISQRLNISMTTVNNRLRSARRAIKEFLDERDASI